jgi:ADP-heptose:LPS heptosyltransferase
VILTVINVHAGDVQFVLKNLELAIKLDGRQDAACMVASDDREVLRQVCDVASKAFFQVHSFLYDLWKGDRFWPVVQNNAWQVVARWLDCQQYTPQPSGWLWWESDAVPLRSGWLRTLSEAHEKGAQPFSGHVVSDSTTPFYQNGVGIWPMKCSEWLADCGALITRLAPFDRVAGVAVRGRQTRLNHLMLHEVKPFGGSIGMAFETRSEVDDLIKSNPQAVFFHGCGDGSLTRLLINETVGSTSTVRGDKVSNVEATPRYSISVVCHNNIEFTRRCIASILLYSNDYELIVTDNGSTDGTAKYLSQLKERMADKLTVITNDENRGFSEPSNTALNQARGEYFVLLNNDMEACAQWLDHLARSLAGSSVALVGLSGTCQSITKDFQGSAGGNLEYIEGSCLMGRTSQLRQFGLFSDYLKFAYYEDVDLSLRVREAGYQIATVQLPMKHHTRGNTAKMVDQEFLKAVVAENKAAMKKRWGHYIATRSFKPPGSICLHRRGANGDVLLLTPVLRALHTRWPETKLFVETDCPQVLAGLPHVTATNRKVNADVRIELDMTYEADASRHIVEVYADVCGVQLPDDWKVEISIGTGNHFSSAPTLMFHQGPSTWISKRWTDERWIALLKHYNGWNMVSIAADKSPQDLAALLKNAHLFIGLDSLPAHISQAVGTPSVVLFGSTNPDCILHPTANVIAVQGDPRKVKCIGEHGRRTKAVNQAPPCNGDCMKAITVEMVLEAVDKLLKPQEVAA